jgi:hypothetical protein
VKDKGARSLLIRVAFMKPRSIVLLIALCALMAKLYCAWTTIGSSDVALFYRFAQIIRAHGLIAMYQDTSLFNHTPLIGWFSEAVFALSRGDRFRFAFYLKLPAILSDFGAVLTLLWLREKTGRPAWWALMLFAASPVAFMVSGYHGNVDSVMAFGLLLAAAACVGEQSMLCGLAFGLSCNVKIVPLLLAPVFFFYWWKRGGAIRFAGATVLCVLIGWSVPLVTIPGVFLKDVLGYGSVWGVWGITYLLRMSGAAALKEITLLEPTREQAAIIFGLKLIVIAVVLTMAWRRRGVEPLKMFETLALAWAVFFVFAPGFGSQYLVWLAPFFLVASERWYAALTAASSVALFVFYNSISGGKMPWLTGFNVHAIANVWAPWLILPWLVLVLFLFLPKHLVLIWKPRGNDETRMTNDDLGRA